MHVLRYFVILPCSLALAFGQTPHRNPEVRNSRQAEFVVRDLYKKVIAIHPVGIQQNFKLEGLSPFLSQALLRRFEQAEACDADWSRQHRDSTLKPPGRGYALFSGSDGPSAPQSFEIEESIAGEGGTYRVFVDLKWKSRVWRNRTWTVVPVVLNESGHFVVDDVTYLSGIERGDGAPLSAYLAAGCDGGHWVGFGGGASAEISPEAFVRNLYQQVIAHRPIGIPWGIEERAFSPYFSNALLHRFEAANACADDWDRKHQPPPIEKPEYSWLELGIFSGGDERASPGRFEIEKEQSENDGSIHVTVRLKWEEGKYSETWRVATVLTQENSHYVLKDVIYLRDERQSSDESLLQVLSAGCDGARWMGYSSSQIDKNQ
jgi:hypothetical protein